MILLLGIVVCGIIVAMYLPNVDRINAVGDGVDAEVSHAETRRHGGGDLLPV